MDDRATVPFARARLYREALIYLDQMRVPYVLTRDYENLSGLNDLDVIVERTSAESVEKHLTTFFRENRNFSGSFRVRNIPGHVLVVFVFDHGICLKFDLIWEMKWKGIMLLDGRFLEHSVKRGDGLYVLDAPYELFLIIIKELIKHKGLRIRDKYAGAMRSLAKKDPKNSKQLLSDFFGLQGAAMIEALIQNATNISDQEITWTRNTIIREMLVFLFKRNKAHFISGFFDFGYWLGLLRSKFLRKGIFLALYGPDGSGKSTLAEKLRRLQNESNSFSGFQIFHFTPAFLPSPVRCFTRGRGIVRGGRPYVAKNRGSFLCFIKLLYYAADFIAGYVFYVKPLLSVNKVVLFDRYFMDFYYDPERARLGLVPGIIHLLNKVVPQPDLNIFLVGDPKILYRRKGELTLKEISKLVDIYTKAGRSKGLVFDTSDESADSIARKIWTAVLAKGGVDNQKGNPSPIVRM